MRGWIRAAGRRSAIGVAIGAALMLGPSVASAEAAGYAYTAVGSFTFAWHGDPARGCAAEGLCQVSGSLTINVGDEAEAASGGPVEFEIADDDAVARSEVVGADSSAESSCADLEAVDFELRLADNPYGGKRVVPDPGSSEAYPSAGDCSGPVAADLGHFTLPARSLGKRGYDLYGTDSFVSGPFLVTVISHLRALSGSDDPGSGLTSSLSSSSSSVSVTVPTPRGRSELIEQANVTYEVVATAGTLTTAFAGLADPFCEAVDTCASSGTTAISVTARDLKVMFSGARVVKRRIGARAALSDLTSGRLPTEAYAGGLPLRATTTGSFSLPGVIACHNTVSDTVTELLSSVRQKAHLADFSLGSDSYGGFSGADLLRSRCPGPSVVEADPGRSVASASTPLSEIGSSTITLTLSRPGSFTGNTYSGTRGGAIVLTLRRIRESAGTSRQVIFPGEPVGL
jgi:hypothetical protein